MFEELKKVLERLNGQSVSIPIESDENGYIDKQCPSEDCEFIFKVKKEDWLNISKNDAAWCPMCRHEAKVNSWFTKDQVNHAKAEALNNVQGKINKAINSDVKNFNSMQPKNSLLSISMKVSGGKRKTHIIPAKAAELMQLEIQCDNCSSRFAVIGSAFFCPACGSNSVTRTFSDSLRKIRAKLENIDIIRNALTESKNKDEAELICRSIIETCISDGVVAFQKYCDGLYEPYGKAPYNAFQRLNEASDLWNAAIGKGFDNWLLENEINTINILYQKRHLLSHSEGIVDSKYILKSGDTTYKEGQRVVISNRDIESLLTILDKLGKSINAECKFTQ
jgi:Zn finger protein HypA/HybF involved in hydrogenase expression